MRIFKYWQKVSKEFPIDPYVYQETNNIRIIEENGVKKAYQTTTCYGGSNISEEDAIANAKIKLQHIESRINGEPYNYEYNVDIQEEIIYKLNDSNIITRNRYGALVLNTDEIMFIDVDHPKITFSRLFFEMFGSKFNAKALMLKDIYKELKRAKHQDKAFRIYETFKGYRIIVCGSKFDPNSKESNRMMLDFNADYLYRILCKKQECYRARLTPKPNRINLKDLRYKFPKIDEQEKDRLISWVKEYDQKSINYASCKFISAHNYNYKNTIVELHDKITDANTSKPLA